MKPLQEYTAKRNFKKTSEPAGKKVKRATKKLSFVVQEHHASHLHYDFRLEMDGVLKSWAVPKGPSPDPQVKRLAVQVEDHPLGYGKFQGEIPAGEYGGGEVFIWDSGTWKPTAEMHAALKKGHLDFTLKGKRMKGLWTLIRTGKSSVKPSWLLFKRSDEYAGKEKNFHPIANYGSIQEKKLLKKKTKKPAKKSVKLQFIEPELSLLVGAPPKGNDWVHEMKFDGYRIQAHVQNGSVKLFTRSGQDWTHKYKTIVDSLTKIKVQDAILDGEVVALDQKGRSDFQALQIAMKARHEKSLVYYVFDLMECDGEDLRSKSLLERKEKLLDVLPNSLRIRYSEHLETNGDQMFKASCEQDLEGIISKRKDSPYTSGRTKSWVKSKCSKRQEFVIGGYSDPQGSRDYFGSLLLGVYDGNELKYVGRCGTGFNGETIRMLHKKLQKNKSKASPFQLKSPKKRDIHWVKPKLVAEVSFANWTREEILRVPVFHGLRIDKSPTEVKREIEKPIQEVGKLEQTTLTHPEKVIYAREKITKLDVANYYRAVAPHILPHILDRPLSMLRCPEGTAKTCFFQKHFTSKQRGDELHPVIHEIMIDEHGGKRGYATIDSSAGLVAMVQSGGFEFHAWGCRKPDIEHPDQIVMDFDPDGKVNFTQVKSAAFELKSMLEELNLKCFVKVTGGKGLHVHIPIDTVYGWDDVKEFSKVLAQHMEENKPELYTSVMSRSKRVGKIFVDYLRNGRSATAVVPYSLRARAISAVALPISWDELKKIKDPASFTLPKTLALLKTRKVDPWKEMLDLHQKITILKEK